MEWFENEDLWRDLWSLVIELLDDLGEQVLVSSLIDILDQEIFPTGEFSATNEKDLDAGVVLQAG